MIAFPAVINPVVVTVAPLTSPEKVPSTPVTSPEKVPSTATTLPAVAVILPVVAVIAFPAVISPVVVAVVAVRVVNAPVEAVVAPTGVLSTVPLSIVILLSTSESCIEPAGKVTAPATVNPPPSEVSPVPTVSVLAPVTDTLPFRVEVPATIKLPVEGLIEVPPTFRFEFVIVAPSTVSVPPTVILPFFLIINASEGVANVPLPITKALSLVSTPVASPGT